MRRPKILLIWWSSWAKLEWGRLTAVAQKSGRPLPVVDGLLLATAQAHGLTFVTRNTKDAEGRGVTVLNPYSTP